MRLEIRNRCSDYGSYRAARVKSLFNAENGCNFDLTVDLPIDDGDWRIGVVVGPSGSGKSSIGRLILGGPEALWAPVWPHSTPIVDAIAPDGDFDAVTAAFAAVGLGSVPTWLRPYDVLSNGEKFRADLARLICEAPGAVVVDEFTSVVDRQIAKFGALAFAKAWRRLGSHAKFEAGNLAQDPGSRCPAEANVTRTHQESSARSPAETSRLAGNSEKPSETRRNPQEQEVPDGLPSSENGSVASGNGSVGSMDGAESSNCGHSQSPQFTGNRAVLLTPHYDVVEWLEPDWVFDTANGSFARGSVRRPPFDLEIWKADWRYWPLFEPHHYLKMPPMPAAAVYVGSVDGELVCHLGVSTQVKGRKCEARACRLVVMPEWQGAGVGIRFLNAVCELQRAGDEGARLPGRPVTTIFHTSHPGLCAALRRDGRWRQVSAVLHGANKQSSRSRKARSGRLMTGYGGHFRSVQGFRYYGA